MTLFLVSFDIKTVAGISDGGTTNNEDQNSLIVNNETSIEGSGDGKFDVKKYLIKLSLQFFL